MPEGLRSETHREEAMSKMSVLSGELGAMSKNIETKMKSFASIFLLVGDLELSKGSCNYL